MVAGAYWIVSSQTSKTQSNVVHASGTIEANETTIQTLLPGRVIATSLETGEPVDKGQLIIQLDTQSVKGIIMDLDDGIHQLAEQRAQLKCAIDQLESSLAQALEANRAALAAQKPTPEHHTTPITTSSVNAHLVPDSNTGEGHGTAAYDMSNGSETGQILHDSAIAANQPPPFGEGLNTVSSATASGDPMSQIMTEQQKDLQKEKEIQLDQIDSTYKTNRAELGECIASECKTIEKAHSAVRQSIAEAQKAAMPQPHFWNNIWPISKFVEAKTKAVKEVATAKRESADSQYKTSIDALNQVCKAKASALDQTHSAIVKATETGFAAKQASLKTIEKTMAAGSALQERIAKAMVANSLGGLEASLAGAKNSTSIALNAVRKSQASLVALQVTDLKARLATLELERLKLAEKRDEAVAKVHTMKVRSPIKGLCASKNIQVGETALPGQVLATIYDPNNIYLRAYIPAADMSAVRVGQSARVFVDSQDKTAPLQAIVAEIDKKAAFTPENVATPQGRSAEVFGVKLKLLNPEGAAKPGMPADAEISITPSQARR